MPYAPGVVDRSGEILAAGRMDMAKGLAQGIGAVGDAMQEYRQNQMRNAVLEGENQQLLSILQKDPELKKYVPEADTLDKLIEKKTTGGGLTLKDNMKLNAMLNTGLKVSKHVSDLESQQMQRQAAAMQVQSLAQKAAQAEADKRALPEALKPFLPGGEMEGHPIDPDVVMMGLGKAGASPDMIQGLSNYLISARKAGAAPTGYATPEEAIKAAEITIGQRKGLVPKFNERNGRYYPEVGQQQEKPYEPTEEKVRAEVSGEIIKNKIAASESASNLLPSLKRAKELLASGSADSGAFTEFRTEAANLAKSFGIPVDEKRLASQQEVNALLNQVFMTHIQKTKGAVSEAENKAFKSMSARPGLSKEANLALLDMQIKRLEYEDKAGKKARSMTAKKNVPFSDVVDAIEKEDLAYNNEVQKMLDSLQSSKPEAVPMALPSNPSAQPATANRFIIQEYKP